MTVRAAMTIYPAFVFPETEIVTAAKLMRDLKISALPVCNGQQVVGIVTATDIVRRQVADDCALQLVGSVMTPRPHLVSPDEPVDRAITLMIDCCISHLPVCDQGELIGILSWREVSGRLRLTELFACAEWRSRTEESVAAAASSQSRAVQPPLRPASDQCPPCPG